ncbi:MAG TPA: hypothetical protein VFJ43_10065, partial [Bacteroidia bacterium]|nr:hypothetical protein [Bacteroidia bacterium]
MAKQIIDFAKSKYNIPVRMLGSMSIALKCPNQIFLWEKLGRRFPIKESTQREIIDLDLLIFSSDERKFKALMKELQFRTNEASIVYGTQRNRLLYYALDFENEEKEEYFPVEVYFERLEMHHNVNLQREYFELDPYCISLTDLFLTKLQYDLQSELEEFRQDQINQFIDMIVILSSFDVPHKTENDSISSKRISKTLSQCSNVKFEITAKRNLREFRNYINQYVIFDDALKAELLDKIKVIEESINSFPKTS